MAGYKVKVRDEQGRLSQTIIVEQDSDTEALAYAQRMRLGARRDLYDGRRLVGRVEG